MQAQSLAKALDIFLSDNENAYGPQRDIRAVMVWIGTFRRCQISSLVQGPLTGLRSSSPPLVPCGPSAFKARVALVDGLAERIGAFLVVVSGETAGGGAMEPVEMGCAVLRQLGTPAR